MDSVTREELPADSYHMPEESHSSSESVASTPRRLVASSRNSGLSHTYTYCSSCPLEDSSEDGFHVLFTSMTPAETEVVILLPGVSYPD